MIDRHLRKLRARHRISADEESAIARMVSEVRQVPAGKTIVRAGELLSHSLLLTDGLLGRYRDLKQGERQFLELHVPGDFADLHGFTLKRLDHDILALLPSNIAMIPHAALERVLADHPRLARIYWFATNLDAAVHREWILSLGRRQAVARTAALFCELHVRLLVVGLAEPDGFAFPLTQTELAECLGLTPVHVNRTLRILRESGLVTFRGSRVRIHDFDRLRAVAEFDPAYLYLDRQPL